MERRCFPSVVRIVIHGPPKGVQRTKARAVINKKTGKAFAQVYTPEMTRSETGVIRDRAAHAMKDRAPFARAVDFRMLMCLPIPASWSNKKRQSAIDGQILPVVKPDYDNCGKFVDALKGIVWNDDAQVSDTHIWKRYSEKPRLIMEIRHAVPAKPDITF